MSWRGSPPSMGKKINMDTTEPVKFEKNTPIEQGMGKQPREQDKWCKHRLKIISNRQGIAVVKCTVCKSVGIQRYKTPEQYSDLQKACKNTRQVDILIERMKRGGSNLVRP